MDNKKLKEKRKIAIEFIEELFYYGNIDPSWSYGEYDLSESLLFENSSEEYNIIYNKNDRYYLVFKGMDNDFSLNDMNFKQLQYFIDRLEDEIADAKYEKFRINHNRFIANCYGNN